MFRFGLSGLLTLVLTASVFAQLPQHQGQYWQEYPISPAMLHGPKIMRYQEDGAGTAPPAPRGPSVLEIIRRETGESVWNGETMGLLGADNQKIYVYHGPAVQQKVAETLDCFLRPDTKSHRFVTSLKYVRIDEKSWDSLKIDDLRRSGYRYLNPILASDGTTSACPSPEISAYWVAWDHIGAWEESLESVWRTLLSSRGEILEAPSLTTLNGQMGVALGVTPREFVTDVAAQKSPKGTEARAIRETVLEGQTLGSFSLLSWDRKTVSTDLLMEITGIDKINTAEVETADANRATIQTPLPRTFTISEKGLVWPADGMLVVFFGGASGSVEEPRKKSPVSLWSDKSASSRRTLNYAVLTVRMHQGTAAAQDHRTGATPGIMERLSGSGPSRWLPGSRRR